MDKSTRYIALILNTMIGVFAVLTVTCATAFYGARLGHSPYEQNAETERALAVELEGYEGIDLRNRCIRLARGWDTHQKNAFLISHQASKMMLNFSSTAAAVAAATTAALLYVSFQLRKMSRACQR